MYLKQYLKKYIPKPVLQEYYEIKRRKRAAQKYLLEEKNNPGDYSSLNAFDYYKTIFIHIPKTAGISIAKTLFGNLVGSHRTYRDYEKIYPKSTLRKYFVFAFVRHPYTRLCSSFYYLKNGGINEYDKEFSEKYLKNYIDFKSFVLEFLNEQTIYSYIHFIPQFEFLINNKGKIELDFIGRYENLNNDFAYVVKKLKLKNVQLPHLNKTGKKDCQLTPEVKEKIYLLYKKDFALLNYKP